MRKILSNISWLLFDRILESAVKLVVGIWLARYLGPENLGVLHYSLAIVMIATSFVDLGQANIVIRGIVENKSPPALLLGTSFVLTLAASIIVCVSINSYVYIYEVTNSQEKYVLSVLSIMILFRIFHVITWWYQSQVLSKHTVIATRIGMVFGAVVKVWLILGQASVWALAWAWIIQGFITSALLVSGYSKRYMSLLSWRFDRTVAKDILTSSWPLIFTGIASVVYLHIDKVMIGVISGNREVGLYTAASRITELFYMLPLIIVSTLYPSIIRAKNLPEGEYKNRIQSLIDAMAFYSYVIILGVIAFGFTIVDVLYGDSYRESASVLQIHAIGLIFMATGVVRNRWLISENKTKFLMLATVLGAAANVALNYVLIPMYQSIGAAWATVISYAVATYVSCLLHKDTRAVFKVLTMGYAVPFRLGGLIRFTQETIRRSIILPRG